MPRKRSKKKSMNFGEYLPWIIVGALVLVFLGAGPTGKFTVTEAPGMFLGFPESNCRDKLIDFFPAVTSTPPDLAGCQSQSDCSSGTFCCVEQSNICKTYDTTKYDETILSDKAFLDKHQFLRIPISFNSNLIGFDNGEVIFHDEEGVIYRWEEGNFDTEGNIKIDELVDLSSYDQGMAKTSFDESIIAISYFITRDNSFSNDHTIRIINTQDPQNYVTFDNQFGEVLHVSGEYIVWGGDSGTTQTLNRWKYGEYTSAGEPDILEIVYSKEWQRVANLKVGRNGEMIWGMYVAAAVNTEALIRAGADGVKTIYWDGHTYDSTGAPALLTFSEDIITTAHLIDEQGNVYLSARESSPDGRYTNYDTDAYPVETRGVQKWDGRTYDESGKPNFEYLFSDEGTYIDTSCVGCPAFAIEGTGILPRTFDSERGEEFVVDFTAYWDGRTMHSETPSLPKIIPPAAQYLQDTGYHHLTAHPGPALDIYSGRSVSNFIHYTGTEAEPSQMWISEEGYEHSLLYMKETSFCRISLTSEQQATCGDVQNTCVNQELVNEVESWNEDTVAFRAAAAFCGEDADDDGYLPDEFTIISTMDQVSFDLGFDALDRMVFDCDNSDVTYKEGIYYSLDLTCPECAPSIVANCVKPTGEEEPEVAPEEPAPAEEEHESPEDQISQPINII